MKKKVLILLTSVIMIFACIPAVNGLAAGNVAKIVETGNPYGSVQAAINAATSGQTVQMLADSQEDLSIISKNIILDLNGKVLKGTGAGPVVTVNNVSLTINDSNTTAVHKFIVPAITDTNYPEGARKAGLWVWDEAKGTETIKGGCITGGVNTNTSECGGGICLKGGTLTMNAGTIVGNQAVVGGGVFAYSDSASSNVTIKGNIVGNLSTATVSSGTKPVGGGGIYIKNTSSKQGSLDVSGTVSNNLSNYNGGGITLSTFTTLNMSGVIKDNVAMTTAGGLHVSGNLKCVVSGTITGNYEDAQDYVTGVKAGGVYINNTNFYVAGTAKIYGNKEHHDFGGGIKTVESNVYVYYSATCPIHIDSENPLTEGANIGVSLPQRAKGVVTAASNADYAKYFFSDLDTYAAVNEGTGSNQVVKLGDPVAKISETGKGYGSVQAAIDAATKDQTVKMLADSKERVLINSDNYKGAITLDLNGYALIGPNKDTAGNDNNVIMFNKSSAELTIKDSDRNQAHYYTYSSSSAWTLNDTASEDAKKNAITLDKVDSKTQDGTLVLIPGGTITGGNRSNNGGGIYVASDAKLTLSGINVIGNTANSGKSGGGVYGNSSSTINCANCNIVGNIAIGTTSGTSTNGGTGGGIYTKGALEIKDSKIEYNQASFDGGALYAYGTSATATNTQFVGNNSARHGGAVYVAKGKTFNAEKCTFSSSKATGINGYGGALYINSETGNVSEATITDCTFENNNAFVSGGGIYNNYGEATITGGSYKNNSAQYAGVIFNDNGTATITGGSYKNNSVTRAGGVIYNDGATLNINGATFESNTASSDENDTTGGFLHSRSANSSSSSVTITGATIKSNQAKDGGAIYNARYNLDSSYTSTITINNCEITGNTANANGGGVYNKCTVIVSGTTNITGNKKGTGDTATDNNVYLESGKTITVGAGGLDTKAAIGVTLKDGAGDVTDTTDAANEKFFTSDNATYTVVFKDNVVKLVSLGTNKAKIVETGELYQTVQEAIDAATNGQTVKMLANSKENVEFKSAKTITLDLNGKVLCGNGTNSVIKTAKSGSKLTITDSNPNVEHKFIPATGTRKAGLWTWDEANGTEVVKGGIITGGNTGNGGGVYITAGTNGELVLEGGSIVGCKATNNGGGVYADCPITMTGGAIIGCEKNGVRLLSNANFTMTGGTISNCNGSGDGGGIYTSQNITIAMSGNAKITECEATNGGGLCIGSDSKKDAKFTMSGNASISKCSASNSTSDSYGGGGVWIRGTMTLKDNASISECEASNGGGVLARSGIFNMEGGSISQCKIVKNGSNAYKGGGVFVSELSTQFIMTGGVIEKCEASVSGSYSTAGGGVYVKNGGSFIFSGGTISQCNTNNKGGGVYNEGVVTVGGTAKITGNTKGTGASALANNLYLVSGKTVTVSTDTPLAQGAAIGVTLGATGGVGAVTGTNSDDYSAYFTADDAALCVYNADNVVKIVVPVAEIVGGKKHATVQAAIDAATSGQTVKMLADSTENVKVGTSTDRSKNITLDLNGKTLKSTGTTTEGWYTNAITNYATLTISDSSADKSGKITGGKGAAVGKGGRYGGGIYNTGGTLTITGGTITGNTSSSTENYAGGGGVYNDATFIMSGGTISGNSAANVGGGVLNKGTMKVSGTAKISDNTNGAEEKPIASNVYLPNGKTITVGTGSGADVKYLEKGASIGVTTADTPTAGSAVNITGSNGTNDYSAYFTSDNASYGIVENGTQVAHVVAIGIPIAQITKGDVTKKFLSVQKAIDFASEGDTIVMLADSTENLTVASDDKVTLDLNGRVLKAATTGSVIANNGTLTIKDSKHSDTTVKHYFTVGSNDVWNWNSDASETDYYVTGGVITGGNNSTAGETKYGNGVANKGTLEIDGVNIVGNSTGNWGGGLLSEGGSVTVKNSLIAHNYSMWCAGVGIKNSGTHTFENTEISNNKSQYEGGGFYIESATATLTKCTVKGNTSTSSHGGGLYLKNGASVTMNEGTITQNSAALSNGAAYLTGTACSLTLNGVSVTDNTAKNSAGGIKIENGHTLSVSGATKISGNTYGTTKVNSNIYLAGGKTITVSAALTKGAAIGVTLGTTDGTGTVTGANSADYHEYFVSDNTSLISCNDKTSDTNQVVKLKKPDPTAIIYSDGTMVFQDGDTEDASHGTVLGKYTGFTTGLYSWVSETDLSTMPPWYQDGKYKDVTKVLFKETIKPENTACWFKDMTKLADGDFDKLDASAVTSMDMMFQSCTVFNPTKAFPEGFGSAATTMNSMFNGCSSIKTLTNLPSGFGAKVTKMSQMFANCSSLTTLDISSINTSAVTTAVNVFLNANNLQTITIGANWKFEGSGTSRMEGLQFLAAKSDTTYGGHWSCISDGTNKGTEYDISTVPNGAGTYTWSKKTTVTPGTQEFTYDGNEHRNTLAVSGPSKYTESYNPADKPTAAGTHTATYTVTPDKDDCPEYETATGTVTTKINKVQLTIEGTTVSDKAYDGNKTATITKGTVSGIVQGEDVKVTASGEFASADKGTHDVTVTYTLSGDGAGNYIKPADDNTLKANITAKTVNVKADNKDSYIGSKLVDLTYQADSLIGDDKYSGALTTTANKDKADEYKITQGTLTAGDNYSINFTDGTYTVKNLETQTLTFAGVSGGTVSKIYGAANFTETVTGNQTTVTYSSSDATVATVNESTGEVTILKSGSTVIKATAAKTEVYASATAEYTLNVSRMKVSVPEAETGLVYNKTEQTGVTLPSAAFFTLSGNTGTDAKEYTATATLSDKEKYTWDLETPTTDDQEIKWSIGQKQLTISKEAKTSVSDKEYNGNTEASATIGTVVGIHDGDDVTVSIKSADFDSRHAGDTKPVTVVYQMSGKGTANYIVPENDTINAKVSPKKVTVKADNKTSYVGSAIEALTYVGGTLCEGDSYTGELYTDANKDVVKDYDILQGTVAISDGNNGGNYEISFTKGTYKVTDKEIQTLKFDDVEGGKVTKTYGDEPFAYTVSGASTTVTYESSDPEVAIVNAETGEVTILKAGTTVITATAEETAVYASASVEYQLTVNKIVVEVPAAKTGLVFNAEQQTGVELPEEAAYTLSENKGTDAGTYTATAVLKDKTNYAWMNVDPEDKDLDIPWTIAKKQVTVAADNKEMKLGEKVPAFTATVTGLIGKDTVSYSLNEVEVEAQGAYSIVPEGEAEQGNYVITYEQGLLVVSKAEEVAKANTEDLSTVLKELRKSEEYKDKTLDIELRTNEDVSEENKQLIAKQVSADKKILYIDADLFLLVTEDGITTEENFGDRNNNLIRVTYKFDFSKKADIQIIRVHEADDGTVTVDELKEMPNADGEFVEFDTKKGVIVIYAKKYSTFSVAYKEAPVPSTGDRNNASFYMILGLLALMAGAGAVIGVSKKAKRQ